MGPDCRQTGLEVDNRNCNENRSHITHESMVRIVVVEDGLQHLENRDIVVAKPCKFRREAHQWFDLCMVPGLEISREALSEAAITWLEKSTFPQDLHVAL
ncbi:hypothetical protein Tco_0236778 [Tanacetum coccineum]